MFEGKQNEIDVAPIGWVSDDMPQPGGNISFEQCISETALAGFTGTEAGGKFSTDTAILKHALDVRGLSIASQWFSSTLCEAPYEENEASFSKQIEMRRNGK